MCENIVDGAVSFNSGMSYIRLWVNFGRISGKIEYDRERRGSFGFIYFCDL